MSILLKGMDMPESCEICDLRTTKGHSRCKVNNHILSGYKLLSGERDSKCPVYYVPTSHGRLIDADELIAKLRYYDPSITFGEYNISLKDVVNEVESMIKTAPTIIKAEG